jgi:hypothetical protein
MPLPDRFRSRTSGIWMMLFAAIAALAAPSPPPGYNLIWHDEFDSLSFDDGDGNATWSTFVDGFWNYGGQFAFYCRNDWIGNGISPLGVNVCGITPQKTVTINGFPTPCDKLANADGHPFVCSQLWGQRKDNTKTRAFYKGYYEYRFRCPGGIQQGMHIGIWMGNKPNSSRMEIDFLESWGHMQKYSDGRSVNDTNLIFASCKAVDGNDVSGSKRGYDLSQWHTFGFLWDDSAHFYDDDSLWLSGPMPPAAFPDSMFLIVSNFIGGEYVDPIVDSLTHFPMSLELDYIRVYTKP